MAGVIETRGTLGALFIKGLDVKVKEVVKQAQMSYSIAMDSALGVENNQRTRLFKDMSTDQARETLIGKTGFGYLEYTAEGSDYKSDSRITTYKTEFNPVKHTKTVTITEEDMDDRIIDVRMDEVQELMIAGMQTMNKHAFDVFNYTFTAQASLPNHISYYADGKPLASTGHPRADGGTAQSNASATSIPLSEVNLETARTALRGQLDDRGQPTRIGTGRLILVVPTALEKLAVQITKSTLRQGTANNDINIYDGIMTVISSKWIDSVNGGSDTAWFLVDSMNSKLTFMTRRPLTTRTYVTDANNNYNVAISARYTVGWSEWKGFWASKGDGSAYSS